MSPLAWFKPAIVAGFSFIPPPLRFLPVRAAWPRRPLA